MQPQKKHYNCKHKHALFSPTSYKLSTMHQNRKLNINPIGPMDADFHERVVQKSCRVCRNNLGCVSYEFSKYTGPAKEVFKIDTVESEIPLPKRICHRCYNVIVRTQKARQEGRYYEHHVEVFTWGRHESEGECRICTHVSDHFKGGRLKKAQVGRSVSTS